MTKIAKFLIFTSLIFMAASVERAVEAWWLRSNKGKRTPTPMAQKRSMVVERETVDITNITWETPPIAPKGENWTFDLFTSPTIVREGTEFQSTLPWTKKSQSTINFEVVEISKKIYPIQFSGYFNQPILDGETSENSSFSFMLSDVQTRESLQVQLGQVVERHNVEILSFTEKGPNGEAQGYPQLKIMDRNSNQEIILTPEKKYYDQLYTIRLRSKVDEKEISLSHAGEIFSIGDDQYVLKKIDEEKKILEFSQKVGKDSCNFSLEITTKNASQTIKTV
ncbi:MAG: hypothetical protein LBB05_02325 [Puniceicoccales bacterium]|jgi:hypothetical protein|nr:hypothetical protein [Puniceicoccales bacterium]